VRLPAQGITSFRFGGFGGQVKGLLQTNDESLQTQVIVAFIPRLVIGYKHVRSPSHEIVWVFFGRLGGQRFVIGLEVGPEGADGIGGATVMGTTVGATTATGAGVGTITGTGAGVGATTGTGAGVREEYTGLIAGLSTGLGGGVEIPGGEARSGAGVGTTTGTGAGVGTVTGTGAGVGTTTGTGAGVGTKTGTGAGVEE